ncbi:MAG: flagellar assembly protein FliW [Planctomycetes bacterium]|nr:flagellar assembly protein FliW [Planctomycetota bacterium]
MLIETTRFGPVEIDESRIVCFREGILGFPNHQRFALIQTSQDPLFFWLQSVDDPSLAFVTCDPAAFVADYDATIRQDDLEALQARIAEHGLPADAFAWYLDLRRFVSVPHAGSQECQVLVIINKHDGCLTANLLGPLVIGARSLLARQLVLSDKRYSTRHQLLRLDTAPAAEYASARTA